MKSEILSVLASESATLEKRVETDAKPYVNTTMKQGIIIFTLLLFLTSCDFKTAEEYLQEADKLSEQQKYNEAINLLDKAIQKDPKYLAAYINRGADKSAIGQYEGAIHDYNIVLNLDPKNTLALFNIGNNFKRLDDFKKAIEFYNKAFDTKGGQSLYLDITPNDFIDLSEFDVLAHEIHFERGIAYYNMDSLQSAFDDFNAAIQQNYRTAECYLWLGLMYIASGQKDLACQYFNTSKQLGDKDAAVELKKYCNE